MSARRPRELGVSDSSRRAEALTTTTVAGRAGSGKRRDGVLDLAADGVPVAVRGARIGRGAPQPDRPEVLVRRSRWVRDRARTVRG